MKETTRFTVSFFSAVLLFFIFNSLEYDLLLLGFSKQIQSAIFSISVGILIFKPSYKYVVMTISLIFLILMTVFYLFNQLAFANFLGSIGVGLLTISATFYLVAL